MNNRNAFSKRLKVESSDDLTPLIEGICQDNNINNYFGAISVAMSQVLEIIISNNNPSTEEIDFFFEQCVGGIALGVRGKEEVFKQEDYTGGKDASIEDVRTYIIANLADNISVSEQGKKIELDFYVDGIEPELLSLRQELIKQYLESRNLNCTSK